MIGMKFVKDKHNIFIGCDDEHIQKAHQLVTYIDDNDNKKKNELNIVKKYNKTKNINDLYGLYDNINEY